MRRIREWWRGPTNQTRGMALATWLAITVIALGGIAGLFLYIQEEKENNCQQRVDSVNSIRLVFNDLYDYAEASFADPVTIEELRSRLNTVLPEQTVEGCLGD